MTTKNLMIAAGIVAGGAVLARRLTAGGGVDFGQIIERMPEDAPPKWMFLNISAIRENTEQILKLLESERAPVGAASSPPP